MRTLAYMTSQELALPETARGIKRPRLFTPPLVDLTPVTSYGFSVIAFARDILGLPLDPWEEEAAIRLGELLPDGRPRFRTVLILVARQNGKTLLAKILILYWLFHGDKKTVLGLANTLAYAKRIWQDVVDIATTDPLLSLRLAAKPVRLAIGEECLTTGMGSEYRIAAANRNAGRSLTVHRLICDELREHRGWDAWNASTNAMNAVRDAQAVCISNQGDDTGVVLDALRASALEYIETGQGDSRLGLFEWSAPDASDPSDLHALAQANPNLGHRIDPDALLGAAMRAKAAGGKELAGFRTEVMCMRVRLLDPAIEPESWMACATTNPMDLSVHRDRVALCLDVSVDGSHATLVAAAVVDGMVHVEVVGAWNGFGCTAVVRRELPDLVSKIKPRQLGWYPAGPAAALTADLKVDRARGWPTRGTELVEVRGEVTASTMGLAELVRVKGLHHPDDPMLNAHVAAAQKLYRGDAFAFRRVGVDPIDGAYALAGAVHLARTMPPPRPPASVY